jgi:thiamine-phosphate pyrophosphorylase
MNLRGYYAILDVGPGPEDYPRGDGSTRDDHGLSQSVLRATRLLQARPCMLQIRAKALPASDLAALARAVLPAAHVAGVPLCVNDRVDVALAVGAAAVHLGQDDLSLSDARRVAGTRLLVGISTHNPEQARAAIAAGADYIGFGPVFATTTKERPDPTVGLEWLGRIAATATVPVVAIGGITLERAAAVAATGAAAAALIAAVARAPDPVAAGLAVNAAFGRL